MNKFAFLSYLHDKIYRNLVVLAGILETRNFESVLIGVEITFLGLVGTKNSEQPLVPWLTETGFLYKVVWKSRVSSSSGGFSIVLSEYFIPLNHTHGNQTGTRE